MGREGTNERGRTEGRDRKGAQGRANVTNIDIRDIILDCYMLK